MSKLYMNNQERISYKLRAVYENYGYTRYEMSKFEEYDLYVRYGDSLISEGVITFTDLGGKLMALKPDVTLSIIKNGRGEDGVQKVYYDEKVYRVPKGGDGYREIPQIGLECMGEIDDFSVAEVLRLAGESLRELSPNSVLDVCHLGILSDMFEDWGVAKADRKLIAAALAEKNIHGLAEACAKAGVSEENAQLLCKVAAIYGPAYKALPALAAVLPEKYLAGIRNLDLLLDTLPMEIAAHVNIDFSAGTDFGYYNGVVFKGYIMGVPSAVLSGGQYGKLMKKMGRNGGAVGFAVYPDLLERLQEAESDSANTLLLYDDTSEISDVAAAAEYLRGLGMSVITARQMPQKASYKSVYKISNAEVRKIEDNA